MPDLSDDAMIEKVAEGAIHNWMIVHNPGYFTLPFGDELHVCASAVLTAIEPAVREWAAEVVDAQHRTPAKNYHWRHMNAALLAAAAALRGEGVPDA